MLQHNHNNHPDSLCHVGRYHPESFGTQTFNSQHILSLISQDSSLMGYLIRKANNLTSVNMNTLLNSSGLVQEGEFAEIQSSSDSSSGDKGQQRRKTRRGGRKQKRDKGESHEDSAKKCDKTKYKTEMCKNWVESDGQFCRYGDKCQFAHGDYEMHIPSLPLHTKYKSKDCAQFHNEVQISCPYGIRCQFVHEERLFEEIHQLHYVHKLNKIIVQKDISPFQEGRRLRVFEQIAPSQISYSEDKKSNNRSNLMIQGPQQYTQSPQISASKPPGFTYMTPQKPLKVMPTESDQSQHTASTFNSSDFTSKFIYTAVNKQDCEDLIFKSFSLDHDKDEIFLYNNFDYIN